MAKNEAKVCETCINFAEWTKPGRHYRCRIYSKRTFMMADMKCDFFEPSLAWAVKEAVNA